MHPRSPADLTIANLAPALALDAASIVSIDTEVIGQGVGILCQLARVRLAYKSGARGPASVIEKFPAATEQTRGLALQFKFYEREVNFYKHLAKQVSLPSPLACTLGTIRRPMISSCCLRTSATAGLATSSPAVPPRTRSAVSAVLPSSTPSGGTARS
jgi:hypothetical protein